MIIEQPDDGQNRSFIDPREHLHAPFDLGTWTELRLGMFVAFVDAHSDVNNGTLEQVSIIDASDYLTFGLKDETPGIIPGFATSAFLGVRIGGGGRTELGNFNSGAARLYSYVGGAGKKIRLVGYLGTVVNDSSDLFEIIKAPNPEATAANHGFYCVRFKVRNAGLATQVVDVSVASTTSPGSDFSPAALRSRMTNTTFTSMYSVAWNDGSAALDLPTAVWLRNPFHFNRIRLAALRLLKIS